MQLALEHKQAEVNFHLASNDPLVSFIPKVIDKPCANLTDGNTKTASTEQHLSVITLLYFCLPLIPLAGRKRRLSAARLNAWTGGMLYRDSVSLTPLIQVFRGRPLALRPLNLVLYAR